MTDSKPDTSSATFGGDAADELDIDELFTDPDSEETSEHEPTTDESDSESPTDDEIEDVTAGELFQQLSAEHDTDEAAEDETYDELSDQSPEEIIASADEAVEPMDEVDEAIAADDDLLDDLLLDGRTKEDGFLWVTKDDGDAQADAVDETAGEADATDASDTTDASGRAPWDPSADEPADDVLTETTDPESIFTADTDDATETADDHEALADDDESLADEMDETDEDDEPSLNKGSPLSATFDGAATEEAEDASVDDGEGPETDDTESEEVTTDDAADADDTEDDDGGSSGGIASKIKSILTG
ncbi:hypothetical protein [Haloarchaeobius sp. DFWS5]|uniref:hypothetical protein n=1 Tax=Haloarchaeobius sp. DFWS5 TaxID=3446114 RepID=UPI003EC14FA3